MNLETWFFKTGPIIFFNSKDRQTAADGGWLALVMPGILAGAFAVFTGYQVILHEMEPFGQ